MEKGFLMVNKIPEGWKECRLGDIADINMGQSPKSENYNDFGEGLPFLQGNRTFGSRYPLIDTYCTNPKKIANEGEILFSVRAPVGDINIANRKICIGRGLASFNAKNQQNLFLFYILHFIKGDIINSESGTVYGSVNKNDLESVSILLPPLPEQKAIASVLSSLDDKIDLLHRQNKTLEAIAETLFRQWFVDCDYSCTISDLIEIQNGYAFKSKDFKDVGVNGVIKIKNISENIVDIYNCDFIEESVANQTDSRFVIKTGDILIAMTGAKIGKMGIVPQTERKLWLNQRVGLLKEKYNGSRFLAYLQLKSDYGQDYIDNTATGSAQPNISGIGIENCEFPKITEKQIKEYSEKLLCLYEKVIFNLGQIRTLEKLRDTLLPKLMSGEVRVRV